MNVPAVIGAVTQLPVSLCTVRVPFTDSPASVPAVTMPLIPTWVPLRNVAVALTVDVAPLFHVIWIWPFAVPPELWHDSAGSSGACRGSDRAAASCRSA